jgi:predicted polyphosphate/ATP-dependent NAD kinase
MTAVGIIANPASGRDIRRLVAHGSVFDNDQKVGIVRRALLGLEAAGVERVWIMPDAFGIGGKALEGLSLALDVSLLSLPLTFTQDDSTRAAARMADAGVRCLLVLGGDGTIRVVAKTSGPVPLVAISTGTNNVFPSMIEGTVAGLAAGLVARGLADDAVRTAPRLDIIRAGSLVDIALVDTAVYEAQLVGSRAMWDASKIKEVVLTGAEAGSIGLSSIGAHLPGANHRPGQGLYLKMGTGGRRVLAPIAPGVLRVVPVIEHRALKPGDEVTVASTRCVLALDGEREIALRPGEVVAIRLSAGGPRVVDVRRAVEIAARAGVFVRDGDD